MKNANKKNVVNLVGMKSKMLNIFYPFISDRILFRWVYFLLLMAAGFGLVISEEALNVWVCPLYWYLHFDHAQSNF
jgi:hypothetical protein